MAYNRYDVVISQGPVTIGTDYQRSPHRLANNDSKQPVKLINQTKSESVAPNSSLKPKNSSKLEQIQSSSQLSQSRNQGQT